jgi:hypothetical protein
MIHAALSALRCSTELRVDPEIRRLKFATLALYLSNSNGRTLKAIPTRKTANRKTPLDKSKRQG